MRRPVAVRLVVLLALVAAATSAGTWVGRRPASTGTLPRTLAADEVAALADGVERAARDASSVRWTATTDSRRSGRVVLSGRGRCRPSGRYRVGTTVNGAVPRGVPVVQLRTDEGLFVLLPARSGGRGWVRVNDADSSESISRWRGNDAAMTALVCMRQYVAALRAAPTVVEEPPTQDGYRRISLTLDAAAQARAQREATGSAPSAVDLSGASTTFVLLIDPQGQVGRVESRYTTTDDTGSGTTGLRWSDDREPITAPESLASFDEVLT